MLDSERREISQKLLALIRSLQAELEGWVELAKIGAKLPETGISYKNLGFPKLRPFLEEFSDILEFQNIAPQGQPLILLTRPKAPAPAAPEATAPATPETTAPAPSEAPSASSYAREKYPTENSWLYSWASIPAFQISALAAMALEERWYYGEAPRPGEDEFPILKNYLAYTFRRLCHEGKVLIQEDPESSEEYAAFNTGLVDRKYDYIYALFTKSRYDTQYWFLHAFVVAGEDKGKTLVRLFNPLPGRADYFENKIENMLYDTSTGDLSCDYTHIITERTYRLPAAFLQDNCPGAMLSIDGIDLMETDALPEPERSAYFTELGHRILADRRTLTRLKNRIADAVDLALKQVEWNYKTAIPTYFPTQNKGSLLLPLALVDEDRVDLALVVERQPSGAYQGQTVLPLGMAYANSRLVARPDSDWLRTDVISSFSTVTEED